MSDETINLWTAQELAAATGGTAQGDFSVNGVAIDSRDLAAGDLFVALAAARDGHEFVVGAIKNGAGGAIVSRTDFAAPEVVAGLNLIVVDDCLLALESLAAASRRRASAATRIAVTGSVGKTTVKEMLAAIFTAQKATHASVKSYNNHWGVPLTLARMAKDIAFGVFEVGMNHPGEISLLSPQILPNVAVVTTVAAVHMAQFSSEAAIADAKAEIFLGLRAGGHALIPADNIHAGRLIARANMVNGINIHTFGRAAHAGARLIDVVAHNGAYKARADIFGQEISWQILEPGDHWVHNGLCALATVALAGGDVAQAAQTLSGFGALAGRGQAITLKLPNIGEITLVDDAYNANPTSMAGALKALASRAGARRLAVLGDMLELGPDEHQYHAGLAAVIAPLGLDGVVSVGPRMAHLHANLPQNLALAHGEAATDIVSPLLNLLKAGDVVLVKGSNGAKVHTIVTELKKLAAG